MFNREDYLIYFDQVLETENKMLREAEWLFSEIKNSEAKSLLIKIINDEKRHVKIAKNLIDLLRV